MHNPNKHMNRLYSNYMDSHITILLNSTEFYLHYAHKLQTFDAIAWRELLRLNAITPKDIFKVIVSSQVTLVYIKVRWSMILLSTNTLL